MRRAASTISERGACSPSSQPSDRATAELVVASARQPLSAASAFALATSQAFGSTRMGGSKCMRRNAAALACWSTLERLLVRQHRQQAIAHAPDILDERHLRAGLAQLAPEPRSVRVERPRSARNAIVPHVTQELGFREHPFRLAREAEEQLVLLL